MTTARAAAIREIVYEWLVKTGAISLVTKEDYDTVIYRLTALEPDWIPVAERLPSEQSLCLVYNTSFLRGAATVGYMYDGKWYIFNHKAGYDSIEVTHWRPLPAPPTNEPKL